MSIRVSEIGEMKRILTTHVCSADVRSVNDVEGRARDVVSEVVETGRETLNIASV